MGLYRSMAAVVLRRPTLLPALLALGWSVRAVGWYRRFPFLPLPPSGYLRWRMETAYGNADATPPGLETERFLAWSWRMRRGGRS
jgi:hypothetical protein